MAVISSKYLPKCGKALEYVSGLSGSVELDL